MKNKNILIVALVIVFGLIVILGLSFALYSSFYNNKADVAKEDPSLSEELIIANWEDYFAEGIIEDFEEEYGVKVELETYDNEEDIFSEVQSDLSKYDLVVVTDVLAEEMQSLKLLSQLNFTYIPNYENIDEAFSLPDYATQGGYLVPYLWGTTGIVANTEFVDVSNSGWEMMWNHEYSGRVSMLNDKREVIGAALKLQGDSLNSQDPDELARAEQKLLEQKNLDVTYLGPLEATEKIAAGELWLSQVYSGDALDIIDSNPDLNLEYIIPVEGTAIWVDNMVIPRDAKHKYTAETFINYLLRPEVSARNASELWYANPNTKAEPLMDAAVLEDTNVYPPLEALEKSEYIQSVGDATSLYNKIWSLLQQ
ncbi:spermidine/putrescine ABC transporter substrate-binding protein [Patescibacteria group bacterium]|nr:spermidine/putrescine ABC transporter substrate-binding protein [Patescibacteria group bacterium]